MDYELEIIKKDAQIELLQTMIDNKLATIGHLVRFIGDNGLTADLNKFIQEMDVKNGFYNK